jgi:hypothetical protein
MRILNDSANCLSDVSRNEPLPNLADLSDDELAAVPCEEVVIGFPQRRQFLRGPLDWPDLCLTAQLPGKALEVWLLLHLRWPLADGAGVTLPARRLAELGVDRFAKRRALQALEDAGLIRVHSQRGCSPRIAIIHARSQRITLARGARQ